MIDDSDFDPDEAYAAHIAHIQPRFLAMVEDSAKRHAKLVESYERIVEESKCVHLWDRTRKLANTTFYYCSKCGASVRDNNDVVDVRQ